MHIAQVISGVQLYVRMCRCVLFRYLGNSWTDCAEIWYLASDPLARLFTKLEGRAQLHVRTCALRFCISGTAGHIALKFSVWLGGH